MELEMRVRVREDARMQVGISLPEASQLVRKWADRMRKPGLTALRQCSPSSSQLHCHLAFSPASASI